MNEKASDDLFAAGCAYCGDPPDGGPVHVVQSAEMGVTVWFHGTGACNVVANNGGVSKVTRMKIEPGRPGALVDEAVARLNAPLSEPLAVAYIETAAQNIMRIDCDCEVKADCHRCLAGAQLAKALAALEPSRASGGVR